MSKRYRIRDRLLLAIAIFGDVADEIIGGGSRAYQYRKLFLYTPPNYKKNPFSTAVSRMLAAGDLKRTIKGGQPYFQITGVGRSQLSRKFPFLKWQNQKWDKLWRMVIFDIKEMDRKRRDLLRHKLLELGFGKLQQSVYISPYNVAEDMYEYIQLHRLEKQVYVLVNKHLFIKNFNQLVKNIWKLDSLNEKYYQVYKSLEESSIDSIKNADN